jgi:hypothetical protein
LGFERTIIEIAYANVGGDSDKIIEEIFRLQAESQAYPTVFHNRHRNPLILKTKMLN